MKAIRESFKTMFFMFPSAMLLLTAGCAKKEAGGGDIKDDFKSRTIQEVQYGIPQGLPFEVRDIEFMRDASKTTKKKIFGSFAAVAVATESLYERVPQSELKKFGIDYFADNGAGNVKSTLATRLDDIDNSASRLSKSNAQYVAATNKINAARLLLDSAKKFEPYLFATIEVAKDAEISIAGTVGAVLSGAKEWAPVEIKITGMKLDGMELTGRNFFSESKKNDSEIIIEKRGTNVAAKNEIARRKKLVADAKQALDDASEILRNFKEPEADAASAEKDAAQGDGLIASGSQAAVESFDTPSNWYDESGISELIRTNAAAARQQLLMARKFEPENPKHHYWSALAYYEMGEGSAYGANHANARNAMTKAVELEPKYKDDLKVKDTACPACDGGKFDACKKSGCKDGRVVRTCDDCNGRGKKGKEDCKRCKGAKKISEKCPACDGTGKIRTTCVRCNNTGKFFWQALETHIQNFTRSN
jgi:DnaJ-class molecular chaperone with C-terminal Zn finger domain